VGGTTGTLPSPAVIGIDSNTRLKVVSCPWYDTFLKSGLCFTYGLYYQQFPDRIDNDTRGPAEVLLIVKSTYPKLMTRYMATTDG
jgi:hypothetical protein